MRCGPISASGRHRNVRVLGPGNDSSSRIGVIRSFGLTDVVQRFRTSAAKSISRLSDAREGPLHPAADAVANAR
jgi:hypothetical protein